MPHVRSLAGLRARAVIPAAVIVTVAVLPVGAEAATQSPAKLDGIAVSTALPGGGSFGLYRFDLQQATNGAQPVSWVAPFTEATNAKAAKYGHCVELDQGAGQTNATLRSGTDLAFDNGTRNTITPGNGDPRVAQIQWLLTSSYLHRADADYATGVAAGAHQSAIWKIVNPGNAANDIGSATPARAQADALADELLAAAQANAAALDPATWSLSVQGGAGAGCAGTSRTLSVHGSPNTTAHLRITGGTATFANGAAETDVALGATGAASVALVDVGTDADTVTVQATLPQWILAQADNGGNQDFAYLMAGAAVVKTTTVAFVPCRDLVVQKSAAGSFTRTYPWSVVKTAGTPVVDAAHGTASIPYSIVATRGAAADTGFTLAGTVRVTNPNPSAVTASVADHLAGAACQIAASATVPAGGTVELPYTCTFATRPAAAVVNVVDVRWPRAGLPDGAVSASAPPVTFATPATVRHGSVSVVDVYAGGAPQVLGTCAQATCTYTLTKQAALPSTPTCSEVTNVAVVRDGTADLDSSSVSSAVCRTPQNLVVTRTLSPGFDRSYDWALAKAVDQSAATTDGAATFTYTVTATKSPAVDANFRLAGSITVRNPNAYAVQGATVTEDVSNGGACAVADGAGRTVPAGGTITVDFSCTYAAPPADRAGTSGTSVSYTAAGCSAGTASACGPVLVALAPQAFAFDAPTSVRHDAVDLADVFDGQAGVLASALTASGTYTYSRTIDAAALGAGACMAKVNVAQLVATDDAALARTADQTVTVCRPGAPEAPVQPSTPVAPLGDTTTLHGASASTTLALTKAASRRSAEAGSEVRFTIALRNTGKAGARSVKVCDLLPRAMTFVSAPGAHFEKGRACWTRITVAAGAQFRVTVVARLDRGIGVGRACNTATATAGNAPQVTAKACVETQPTRDRVTGETVGVTG